MVDIAAQIASGMQYLESRNLTHQSLAARNIFVVADGVVKIADFGYGTLTRYDDSRNDMRWTALEVLNNKEYSIKSDVWSYGILLVELTSIGQVPYPGLTSADTIWLLESGERHPKPPKCPEPMYEMMLKCWDQQPEKRPSFEFLFHFFDDYGNSVEHEYT